MKNSAKSSKKLVNVAFIALCAGLLIFLYLAPEETTSPLPKDETHLKFHQIQSKKEADKLCAECHAPNGDVPLPETHPDPYRCLFCHKR